MKQSSIITRISLAIASIIFLGISTMLLSYWVSEKAENDSLAINISGSLRMQTYRLGFAVSSQQQSSELQQLEAKIESTWRQDVFRRLQDDSQNIRVRYHTAFQHWEDTVKPNVKNATLLPELLKNHVLLIDALVTEIQREAEFKVRAFRLIQIIALFLTLLVSSLVIYSLKIQVEQPLLRLTTAAKKIMQGDFTYRVHLANTDQTQNELTVLANTINKMNAALGELYTHLEQQVDDKTKELTTTNTALQFLYETASLISEHNPDGFHYQDVISKLSEITDIEDIELCLITRLGDHPYLQIQPADETSHSPCQSNNCAQCKESKGTIERTATQNIYRFQVNREVQHYGVIVVRLDLKKTLEIWQEQLIQSICDQIAIGLSLKDEEDQSRRIAILQERNVIARELHDSLAQALSYLKIQVTRLNGAISNQDKQTMESVAGELKQGLNNAYRQLRELLTTFRLKIDGEGLRSALEFTVDQLSKQTRLKIQLIFQLQNIPLEPNEEIHLLQIIREASQNAIHHSQGSLLTIRLYQDAERKINLAIEDDGVGMPDSPEKINHYGLAIMRERGKHLAGDLTIVNRLEAGVGVYFSFLPQCILKQSDQLIAVEKAT